MSETAAFPTSAELSHLPLIGSLVALRDELDFNKHLRTTDRRRQKPYGVTAEQITPEMSQFADELMEFMIDPSELPWRQGKALTLETAMSRLEHLYRVWGYRLNHDLVKPDNLDLPELVIFTPIKSAQRKAKSFEESKAAEHIAEEAAEQTLEIACRYVTWLTRKRKVSPATEVNVWELLIMVAKFLYCKESNYLKDSKFTDIPVIVALRKKHREAKAREKKAPPVAKESRKWLDWPDFLKCVNKLEQECLPFYHHGEARSKTAVATSYKRFLIFAFLAFLPPDRQRTLRQLEEGRTLVKGFLRSNGFFEESENGNWYIHLLPEDYKTGETYGEQWHLVPSIIYPHLEAWLRHWRQTFQPSHNFVFTQNDGKPFRSAGSFGSVFRRAAYRITGQLTTPHLVRHMLITYLKLNGASDAIMSSLADAMHHSREAQNEIYDRRKPQERVELAQEAVLTIAQGQPLPRSFMGQPITAEALFQDYLCLNKAEQQRFLALMWQILPSPPHVLP